MFSKMIIKAKFVASQREITLTSQTSLVSIAYKLFQKHMCIG